MIDEQEIIRTKSILEEMTEYIEDTIAYADISDVSYEVDEEMEEIICILTFSRGTGEYQVGINWFGIIDAFSKNIPKMLLVDIHNAICGRYLKGIMDLAKKEHEIEGK